jgi:hypothetical protein
MSLFFYDIWFSLDGPLSNFPEITISGAFAIVILFVLAKAGVLKSVFPNLYSGDKKNEDIVE